MLIFAVQEDLGLAYANTRSWRGSEAPTERLKDIADLLGWIERSAGVGLHDTQRIRLWSREYPTKAARLFTDAIAARETIYRIFSGIAEGEPVREQDFTALTNAIAEAPSRKELVRSDGRYAWHIGDLRPSVTHLLAPVLWSAGDLILAADRHRIRRCANDECRWLFLDESKSGTRRWCDMASCGNRAKARRHYSKIKQS